MADNEIEIDPVSFITIGTVGPKGRRRFYLQAAKDDQVVSLVIEKQQALSLAEAITELLDGLQDKFPSLRSETEVNLSRWDMALRDPIEPLFRVSQMGLGFDEERSMIVLVAQELIIADETESALIAPEPQILRVWATREQMRALSEHSLNVVKRGRADPKTNGYMIYYWT